MITQDSIMNKLLRKQGKRAAYLRPLHYGKLTSEYLVASVIFGELEKLGLVTVQEERTQIRASLTLKGLFWNLPKPVAEYLERVRTGEVGEECFTPRPENRYHMSRLCDALAALLEHRYIVWRLSMPDVMVQLTEQGKKEWTTCV